MRILYWLILLTHSAFSYADVLIEPNIGFHLESRSAVNNHEVMQPIRGFGGGLRFGYSGGMLIAGADIAHFKMTRDTQDETISLTEIGAFFGIETSFGLRSWLSLNFMNVYKFADREYDGSGIKLGIGYSPINFLSINIEYKDFFLFRLNESFIDDDLIMRGLLLSVSAPIRF